MPLYHFDVYRLKGPEELETVGYQEYFYGRGVSVIEWADKITGLLPDDILEVSLTALSATARELVFCSTGSRYKELMECFKT